MTNRKRGRTETVGEAAAQVVVDSFKRIRSSTNPPRVPANPKITELTDPVTSVVEEGTGGGIGNGVEQTEPSLATSQGTTNSRNPSSSNPDKAKRRKSSGGLGSVGEDKPFVCPGGLGSQVKPPVSHADGVESPSVLQVVLARSIKEVAWRIEQAHDEFFRPDVSLERQAVCREALQYLEGHRRELLAGLVDPDLDRVMSVVQQQLEALNATRKKRFS